MRIVEYWPAYPDPFEVPLECKINSLEELSKIPWLPGNCEVDGRYIKRADTKNIIAIIYEDN